MEFCVKTFAITGAILGGAYFFVAALFAMQSIAFFGFSDQVFELVSTGYPGFAANIIGAVIGFFHGVVCGGVFAGLFALVHNFVAKKI